MSEHYRSTTRAGLIVLFAACVVVLAAWRDGGPPADLANYHTAQQLEDMRSTSLVVGSNTYFKASGNCNGCHGTDPNGYAMVIGEGTDVNVVDDWRSTMMGNSARDPFWLAKVSHEVQVNPGHQAGLEDKCTSCHAPMGRHDKHLTGAGLYSMAELQNDLVAQDGVSCVPCHIQSRDSIGLVFSGNLKFDTTDRPLYGPFGDLLSAPMQAFVGYTPQYGEHIMDAGLCAGCHTLGTETADLDGNFTGQVFFEQATYHEWLNSNFNDRTHVDGITCQGCHVPQIPDAVVLSANYLTLQGKSPFGLHHFAGANTFMLNMLKDHIDPLGLTATATQFDSTISRTERMLRKNSLMVDATMGYRDADTAFVNVKLINLAGHKFPSGYPSRRAWVELVVTNASDDTLFRSGGWNSDYEVIGHDAQWEPHYDVITDPDQAQIYEMVMADVNGNKTTVLERAATKLKDDRLAPAGFSVLHNAYDTSAIADVPASDIDFNHDEMNVEGSGSDIVHYHVPMGGYVGLLKVKARVWYQSSPPKWMEEMFAYNSTQIDQFRSYYHAADNSPFLVQEDSLSDLSVAVDDLEELGVRIFPNPVQDGMLTIMGLDQRTTAIDVFDLSGKHVAREVPLRQREVRIRLPFGPATYLVVVHTEKQVFSRRVVAL